MIPRRYLTVDDWRVAFDAEVIETDAPEVTRLEQQDQLEHFPLVRAETGHDQAWEGPL